jgi:hypothetical protein
VESKRFDAKKWNEGKYRERGKLRGTWLRKVEEKIHYRVFLLRLALEELILFFSGGSVHELEATRKKHSMRQPNRR